MEFSFEVQSLSFPEDCNVILGQSHFIKTVEDIYEIMATSSPSVEFGIAFCEASGDCLIRWDGNSDELIELAVNNARLIGAGHTFFIVMRKGFPISVLNSIKSCQEVCRIFAATANPLQVILLKTAQGRGIAGVVDGSEPLGVETQEDIKDRKSLLRDIIGYKR